MARTKGDLSELVQARISRAAKRVLISKATESSLSEAAYVRRLIYRDLKIIKEGA